MPDTTTVVNDQAQQWATGLDDDMKGWVGGMGLDKLPADQALAKVLPMYRGAEQKLGVPADQVLRLPGKDAKPEEWGAVWTRLGRPEKPEGYEIKPMADGKDDPFLTSALGWFHELGVPKGMAQGIMGKYREHMQGLIAGEQTQWNERFEKEMTDLRSEWGNDFDKNADLSQRVQRAMGLSNQDLTAIERALGPKKFLQTFSKFGSAIGEHRFVGKDQTPGAVSQEAAQAKLEQLRKDEGFQKKLMSGDAEANAQWTKLHQEAFGTAPANVNIAEMTA